ncbi:peptidase C12, ubiquitin carboxyl-terminal hydrolase 1 [Panus rudis PR-1116 ss-1]|nr:peptidase C12, ubiquitin carboxyl-terminal hydrolase 1 [Panus rudis PR-1116 ss-1]
MSEDISEKSSTRWVPLESNPEVMNAWSEAAGLVTSDFQFSDVFGLDEELLGMVPQPVKAVVLLFPITEVIEQKRIHEDTRIAERGQHPIDPNVIWIKQTIGNACGTMGLLHAIANSDVKITPDSPIDKFIKECRGKTPLERAHLLETTPLFSKIHAAAASAGQTSAPSAEDKVDLHFTCFVSAPDPEHPESDLNDPLRGSKRLLELDGRRNGPIDRGFCTSLLHCAARVIKENYVETATSVHFSMLALASPPDF